MNRRPRRAVLAGVLSLVAGLGLAGCSGTNAVSQDVAGSQGFQVGDSALNWIKPADRSGPVSGVSGELLDGARFDLSQWRGHVVVVNFWASWCSPCRQEVQALEGVYAGRRDKGVEFLGVDTRDGKATADTFVASHHVGYPSLYDEAGTVGLHFSRLAPNATPTTIVLDRAGRIAARHSGAILYTQLRDVVDRVLAEPA